MAREGALGRLFYLIELIRSNTHWILELPSVDTTVCVMNNLTHARARLGQISGLPRQARSLWEIAVPLQGICQAR